MRFAEPMWLFGALLAIGVAGLFIWGGLRLLSDVKRFGVPSAVEKMITSKTGGRRAFKASLTVLTVALAFVALAGPQYGRGTRLIPATNLDCVVVLDYSKSMYARDVAPSRTERAKAEVARLIQQLPGARFGAVAFAGEPLSFPLTSDGGAIAQFFRQMTPNDMPVGGTAIARALESARELLARDPLSAKHQKVILLVTDGEDLEGDPVEVAKAANKDGVMVHVVQIGGRAPEPIPEVDEAGQVIGMRKDGSGKPITTALSAQGEAQLTRVAQSGGGNVVRSEAGQTGLDDVTRSLKRFMTEELSERVETVYADVFHYPLIVALLLLLVETFVPLASRGLKWGAALLAVLGLLSGCARIDDAVFTRYSPDVDEALANLGARDAGDAHAVLAEYLSTGKCKAGEIGTPDSLRQLPNAAYDLGLALFELGERFGGKLGDRAQSSNDPNAAAMLAKRSQEVDCALRITRLVAFSEDNPVELRAKAFFLSGNLEFLRHDYKNAVSSYDDALRLIPGGLAKDPQADFAADAAFNRAIALRWEEEEEKNKPKPPDAGPQPPQDGGTNSGDDEQTQDQKQDDKDQDKQEEDDQKDQKQDQDQKDEPNDDQKEQSKDDQKQDPSQDPGKQQDPSQPKPEPSSQSGAQDKPPSSSGANNQAAPAQTAAGQPPSLSQDDRILEMLERAPMFQPLQPGQMRGRPGRLEDK